MSNSEKILAQFFAINSLINGSYSQNLEELIYMSNEDVRDLSISLILEIRQLEEEGYTYEEILNLINECDFSKYDLKDDEKDFLKRDAKKTLKIVYNKGEN